MVEYLEELAIRLGVKGGMRGEGWYLGEPTTRLGVKEASSWDLILPPEHQADALTQPCAPTFLKHRIFEYNVDIM